VLSGSSSSGDAQNPKEIERNMPSQITTLASFATAALLISTISVSAPAIAQDPSLPDGKPHSHTHAPGEIGEEQAPFIIDVTYTADIWQAASGGRARGTRYLDNLDIVAEADMERLVGWNGATVHVYGLYNNGKSINTLMGDAQVASNIETGVRAVRLYEAWVDQKIGETASVKLGLYDLNSEFDALESSGLFMGSAHGIGTDISQSGENGPSIFPATSLAARFAISPAKGWTVRAAILDGVPGDPARPKSTAIKLGNGDGVLLIGEVEAPLKGGKLLFGHWRYTALTAEIMGVGEARNNGFYLRGEVLVAREAGAADQGLSAFFRLGTANAQVNAFRYFASGGLNYTGPFKGRDQDQIGLAMATAFTSKSFRLLTPSTKAETVFELTYRTSLNKWLTVQPNVQYVINPGADATLSNALAFGLRAELTIRLP
jgi:porin